ncbi:hypothetical protein Tco_0190563 [Tanacetum coccineum]
MQEPSESTPTISSQQPSQVTAQGSKDKGKEKMIEPKKPLKKKIKFSLMNKSLRLQAHNLTEWWKAERERVLREDEDNRKRE